MCLNADAPSVSRRQFLDELLGAGFWIDTGVPGIYGHSAAFDDVVTRVDSYLTQRTGHLECDVMRFPPLLPRAAYARTGHLETFPHLMGSVHTFAGNQRDAAALADRKARGEAWADGLTPAAAMLTPAVCYPLYPTLSGTLSADGRTVDLCGFVFRHEPSDDPARMQIFRQREFVRVGTPAQARAHRDEWIERGAGLLQGLGLDVMPAVANDPFFGAARRVMAATQREQELKYELVIPITSTDAPTAVASSNYHLDHFGEAFDIRTAGGACAHSACIGFGLERVALALLHVHGLALDRWPVAVRDALWR